MRPFQGAPPVFMQNAARQAALVDVGDAIELNTILVGNKANLEVAIAVVNALQSFPVEVREDELEAVVQTHDIKLLRARVHDVFRTQKEKKHKESRTRSRMRLELFILPLPGEEGFKA